MAKTDAVIRPGPAAGRAMAAGVEAINEVRAGGAPINAAQLIARMSGAALGDDDPDTRFYAWLGQNTGRLAEACAELGITVEPGPRFAHRLRDAVAPVLTASARTTPAPAAPPRAAAVEAGLAAGTMLDAPQLDWLYYLARTAPDGPAVEVGVWKGGSILCWGRVRKGRGPIVAVDSFYGQKDSKVRDRFLENRKASGLRITLRVQEGHVAAEHFHDDVVAFVFIDACHDDREDEGIGLDLKAWVPKIMPGGILVFHDYGAAKCPAVAKVVDAWQAEAQWEALGIVGSAIAFRRPAA